MLQLALWQRRRPAAHARSCHGPPPALLDIGGTVGLATDQVKKSLLQVSGSPMRQGQY